MIERTPVKRVLKFLAPAAKDLEENARQDIGQVHRLLGTVQLSRYTRPATTALLLTVASLTSLHLNNDEHPSAWSSLHDTIKPVMQAAEQNYQQDLPF